MNLNLNYEGFENYLLKEVERRGGIQYVFKFENNYGASVIKNPGSYGYGMDLWELGVLWFTGEYYDLHYGTDITDDVLGYLTNEEVLEILKRIQKLEG